MDINETIEHSASGENVYHHHLDHCSQCRNNPFDQCTEGDRSLRQAVEEGSPYQYDRDLDRIRNGVIDD